MNRTTLKKTLLAAAVGASMGVAASSAQALTVLSWDLQDFNNDGLKSDFAFFSAPTGNSSNAFGAAGEMCGVSACVPIAFDSGAIDTDVFSTGFNFGGTGDFKPNVTGNMSADITGGVLSFSALDFGGKFPGPTGSQFFLAPDNLGAVNVETITSLGGNQWGVVVRYISTIINPTSPFNNFQANWRIEGVMTTVPVPAAVWLLGSGLIGLVGVARRRRSAA